MQAKTGKSSHTKAKRYRKTKRGEEGRGKNKEKNKKR